MLRDRYETNYENCCANTRYWTDLYVNNIRQQALKKYNKIPFSMVCTSIHTISSAYRGHRKIDITFVSHY